MASEGVTVHRLGMVPTPMVAYAAQRWGAMGAVVSASHNPFHDNGIKLFAPGGLKLPDDVEARIEAEMHSLGTPTDDIGVVIDSDVERDYLDHVLDALGDRGLMGLKIVVDGANGAASFVGPELFRRAGAEVVAIGCEPDGRNINLRCGATHPGALAEAVVAHGAHLGLALDGDADRLIAVDATGRIVDGDHVMAILALDLRDRGQLHDDTVVVTVMTNLGFRLAMQAHGVKVVETAVGDRYVLSALDAGHYSLGGEQSGHVILRDRATTGDGLLTGLVLADVLCRTGRSLADLASVMTSLPQLLVNVKVMHRRADLLEAIAADVRAEEAVLGERGRVLVRPSGTEPVVRVMVEAPTQDEAQQVAMRLAGAVERAGA
jgi:phosphoglucosamine mutase